MDIESFLHVLNREEITIVPLKFDPQKKEDIFLLGMVFASGKRLAILNREDIPVTEDKSFNNMALHWCSKGLKPCIEDNPIDNKIFLICPVRKANDKQKEEINDYIEDTEKEGYIIHYPDRDTQQNVDKIGYQICTDNAKAIGESRIVNIFYDNSSTGTLFDLGVAYYFMHNNFNREFNVIKAYNNDLSTDNFGDNIVKQLLYINTCNKKRILKK